jgi:opacity protein-like surface antigen
MLRVCTCLMPWVLSAMLWSDLHAQSAQPYSLQASGMFNAILGGLFTNLKDGWGAEAQFRYTPGALSVGAGFQFTYHALEARTEDAILYGGFIEPRYRIYAGSNVVAPYLSARLALLKMSFTGGDLSLSSIFVQLNGGAGLLFRLSSRFNLDLGTSFGYDQLGKGTLTSKSGAPAIPVPSTSGSNAVVRLGLAIGLRD